MLIKSNVEVQISGPRQTISCSALVDTGNRTSASIIMSTAIARRLQLKINPAPPSLKIGTAKRGGNLRVIGIAEPVKISVGQLSQVYQVRPLVLAELSHGINLGSQFLAKAGLTIDYSKGDPRMICPLGQEAQFINFMKPEPASTPLKVVKNSNICNDINKGGSLSKRGVGDEGEGWEFQKSMLKRVEIVSAVDTWIPPLQSSRVAVQYEGSRIRLNEDQVKGLTTLELGVRGDPRENPGKCNSNNLKNANSEISAFSLQGSPAGRCLTVVNRTSSPIRIVPGQVLALGESIPKEKGEDPAPEEELEDPDKWEPKVHEQKGPVLGKEARIQALWKELKLDEKEILIEDPTLMEEVKELIAEYEEVFKSPEHPFGRTDLVECKLRLKPDTKPIKQKGRPMNPKMEKELKSQIDLWLAEGVIEKSQSPWSSPLVPVRKKDGTTRYAVDYRQLNSACIPDAYPLPRIGDTLDKLSQKGVFSTLDASSAYWTIPLHKDSRELTAFSTPWGLYQWRVLPFGLMNAGSVYSRFIARVLEEGGTDPEKTSSYLDDAIIGTKETREHVEELRVVLEAHRRAGIKLNPGKTMLFEKEVTYLGHQVTKTGIKMVPEYIQRILDWPQPKTVQELKRVLGFLSYYRAYIVGFAEQAAVLNEQRNKKILNWTPEMTESMEKLKQAFKEGPMRAYPIFGEGDEHKPFILTTDYSGKAISAVLSQQQAGGEKLIAACGRRTSSYEKNYPSFKGELAAIVFGIRKFEHLCKYATFEVHTDASALRHLKTLKNPTGILQRYLEVLSAFSFRVIHKAGVLNTNADALSRSTHLPEPTEEEVQEQEIAAVSGMQCSKEEMLRAQQEDRDLQEVSKWVNSGTVPQGEDLRGQGEELKRYSQIAGAVKRDSRGLLVLPMSQPGTNKMVDRVLVPPRMRDAMFQMLRCHPSAGHFGMQATLMRAHKYMWYPNFRKDLQHRIRICGPCLEKLKKTDNKDTVHVPRKASYPYEVLYIDLVGPLGNREVGPRYVLTCEDGFTRFTTGIPIPNKESATVARALMDNIIHVFGCPERIHSDQGSEFTSNLWNELMEQLGIEKSFTPVANPNSNIIERYHRVLGQTLRVLLGKDENQWPKWISAISFAYNTKVNAVTGVTPYEALFNRHPRIPLDIILENPADKYRGVSEFVSDVISKSKQIYEYMMKHGAGVIKRNTNLYSGRERDWKPGQLVWYCNPRITPGKPEKLQNRWSGPFIIQKRIAEVLVDIIPANTTGRTLRVHVTRLKEYHGDPRATPKGNFESLAEDLEGEEVSLQPRTQVELGVPVWTGGGGVTIQDRAEILKDEVAGTVPLINLPPVVEDETVRTDQPIEQETEPPPVEMADIPVPEALPPLPTSDDGMESEPQAVRGNKRTIEPTRRPAKQRARLMQEARRLADSSTSASEDELLAMQDKQIEVPVLTGSKIPVRGSTDSAAYDITAASTTTLPPGQVTRVDLKLALAIPSGYFLKLQSRSGLAAKGIITVAGVIDADYRGPVQALLINLSATNFTVKKGQRCVQATFFTGDNYTVH